MNAGRTIGAVLIAALVVSGCARQGRAEGPAVIASTAAPSPSATPYMIDGTPATDPALDDIAQALGDQGRGAFADTYSDIYVDKPPGAVTLYVTNIARGQKLVDAAKKAH